MYTDSFTCLDKDQLGSKQFCFRQAMFASVSVYECVYGSLGERRHTCVLFKATVT